MLPVNHYVLFDVISAGYVHAQTCTVVNPWIEYFCRRSKKLTADLLPVGD
jgi:hypothetical protein